MKEKKFILAPIIILLFLFYAFGISGWTTQAKTVVGKRLAEVRRDYPSGSRINAHISVNDYTGGGCNALVMYTTLKIFHNAYDPSVDTYDNVGKATSTKNVTGMRKLFRKAKAGDVVRWRKGYTDSHFAIFLSGNAKGVYVYEANFGSRNKVWDKHFWPWSKMRTWPSGGADKVNVYRSKNYNQVNQKKTAKNYKAGDEFSVQGIRYRVKKAKAITGVVKWIGYEPGSEGKKIPKYLYVNRDTGEEVNSNRESRGGSSEKGGKNAQIVYKVKK